MLGYAVTVFYGFWMNEAKDGYDIVCELAFEFPVDVTANYAGNETYGTSDYVYYTPTSNTYYLALNTDYDMLKSREVAGVNKTILTYIDFRKAMSYSFDRSDYVKSCAPPNMIYPPKGDAFAEQNKYAMKIDFEREPPFFRVSDTHYAATWLLHPDAPKIDPPKSVTDRINAMKEMEVLGNERS